VVDADRVYVTETIDREREAVRAFDRRTGELLWRVDWRGALSVPFFAKANGDWIRSTPALAGGRLFVGGMEDVLVCLEAASGRELWRVDFPAALGTPREAFGFVCSPLVDGESVFVQCGSGIVRLSQSDGEIKWRVADDGEGMYGGAFSSPVMATLAGTRQLVVQTRKALCGLDPASGARLWSIEVPAFRGMNILTPVVLGDGIFTSSYGGGSFFYEVSRGQERAEQATTDGETFHVREVWKTTMQGYMSSPVVVSGRIYVHLRNQRFTCVDPASGSQLWTSKPYGKYWSLITQGDRLLTLDERGELFLFQARADREERLDSRKVPGSSTWAHLAAAGDQLFIRDLEGLSVLRWKSR
jgi:outer membrane protein assembly factor BamB